MAGDTVFAIIAARGGSRGLPRKNVLPCGGRPVIEWSVAAARTSRLLDRAVLSTDDAEIQEAARSAGCEVPFTRPAELATDTATMDGVILHAVSTLKVSPGWLVLLQASSPLRTGEDIDRCLETALERKAPACISVTAVSKSPRWMYELDLDGRLAPLFPGGARTQRRQELPPTYVPNGAVYVARTEWFSARRTFVSEETVALVMPAERSVDVDTQLDLDLCDLLLRRRAG